MSNLTETSTWEAGVYQLETTDPVLGGPGGISNWPAQQLANRTTYLKARADSADGALAAHTAAVNPHPQYLTRLPAGAALPTTSIGPIWHDDYAAVLTWNGSAYTPYLIKNASQIFTESGTFYVPAGVRTLYVSANGAGGGGAGAAVYKRAISVAQGQAITITVGKGGAGGAVGQSGTAGGTTSVGSYLTLPGGGGAVAAPGTSSGGAGGGAGGAGGMSGASSGGIVDSGGVGGSSIFGAGGAGGVYRRQPGRGLWRWRRRRAFGQHRCRHGGRWRWG